MCDDEEESAALVVDNGSGMCKVSRPQCRGCGRNRGSGRSRHRGLGRCRDRCHGCGLGRGRGCGRGSWL